MSKELTKTETDFLNYICLYHLVDKSLMRLIGYNYDYSGRTIKKLITEDYIEEITVKHLREKESFIRLTNKGLSFLFSNSKSLYELYKKTAAHYSGSQRQLHQLRGNVIIQILHPIFPFYDDLYLKHLSDNLDNKLNTSVANEIQKRKTVFGQNSFLISVKEIRDLDKYGLRNITGTRCRGLVDFGTGVFALYNQNRRRMKTRNDFERKMRDYIECSLDLHLVGCIDFGRSFKPARDTLLKTSYKQRSQFLMTRNDYENHYFVPLTKNGSEQLKIFKIKDFREKCRKLILYEKEIELGKNMIYDGKDEHNDILYLGFECNITEIEKLMHTMNTVCVASGLKIYCFPFQSGFYKSIFSNAQIIPVEINQILNNIH